MTIMWILHSFSYYKLTDLVLRTVNHIKSGFIKPSSFYTFPFFFFFYPSPLAPASRSCLSTHSSCTTFVRQQSIEQRAPIYQFQFKAQG